MFFFDLIGFGLFYIGLVASYCFIRRVNKGMCVLRMRGKVFISLVDFFFRLSDFCLGVFGFGTAW